MLYHEAANKEQAMATEANHGIFSSFIVKAKHFGFHYMEIVSNHVIQVHNK